MDQRGRARISTGTRRIVGMATVCLTLVVVGIALSSRPVSAAQAPPDSACRLCHIGNEETMQLPSGETLSVGVDPAILSSSVHGTHAGDEVYCTDCHVGRQRYQYPHQPNPAETIEAFEAEIAENCEQCHVSIELHNPGHLGADEDAAVPTCVDCHGGHDVAQVGAIYADPVAFCQTCHTDYAHPQVAESHAELAQNLGPDQDCQTCHNDEPVYPADAECKTCHALLTSERVLPSGETIDLHVDLEVLRNSVHGVHQVEELGYNPLLCTDCHTDISRYGFPHPELTAEDARTLSLEMDQTCQTCHAEIYEEQLDSVHGRAQEEGVDVAATCTDCHGSHDIQVPDEPRERISHTCGQCHSTIYEEYAQSVHGAALLGEQNPDVAVCTDCHGVHSIEDPTTPIFRVQSPTLCAGCHADEEMMSKYGISTDVFDTYVADFHGTTVQLFEKQSPEHETNKAVCYDCHGVHNILAANDENSQVIRENLLETCRQCHPDANANFPDSWTSHFRPSLENNPIVFLVDWFYRLLIPAVIGGFALFIGSDVYHIVRTRRNRKENGHDHS